MPPKKTSDFTPSSVLASGIQTHLTPMESQPFFCVDTGSPPNILFKSASLLMQRIYKDAVRIAKSPHTVLITGPTGGGKEVLARFIHEGGVNPNAPFIAVNCGAIPENLIESELFGHEKGAFTGALSRHEGFLSLTGKGTLFLDEIGDLPLYQQAKLLRVIENRSYWPVGSAMEKPFLGRIIAATNVNLKERVSLKTFREDLFYRLSVFCIEVPGLDERREDIPALALHFAQLQPNCLNLTPDALKLLGRLDWPGNVRQLRHTIERIAVLSDDAHITAEVIQKYLPDITPNTYMLLDNIADKLLQLNIQDKPSAIEYAMMIKAMQVSGNNKTEAARLLGVHRKRIERGLNSLEDNIRKIQDLCKAAEHDLAASAVRRALSHYEKAGKLLEKFPYSRKMDELYLDILVKQSICQRTILGWKDSGVTSTYEKAQNLGKRLNRTDRLSAVTFGIWVTHLMNLDLDQARQTAEEYLEEGRLSGNHLILSQAYISIANTYFWMGDQNRAEGALQEFLECYRHDGNVMVEAGQDPFILYLMFSALISFQRGHLKEAKDFLGRLVNYSETLSHAFSRAIALQACAWVEYLFGDLKSANDYAQELITISQQNGFPFYEGIGMIFHGVWLAANGQLDEGGTLIHHGYFDRMCKDGGRLFNSMYGICLADSYCLNERWDEAMKLLEPVIELSRQKGELCYLSDQLRLRGCIHKACKNIDAAEKDFRAAMVIAEHQGSPIMERRSRRHLHRLLIDTGREEEATAILYSTRPPGQIDNEGTLLSEITPGRIKPSHQ